MLADKIRNPRLWNPEIQLKESGIPRSIGIWSAIHEEPHKVPLLIILSDMAQFPVIILPKISCMLAGV